jgi:TPR repeat protein
MVALIVGMAAPAWTGYDEGIAAYKRGDYETAFQEMKPLAEQGHAPAQASLGFAYDTGQGVPQDYAVAAKWYRKAAEQGNAGAQYNLGQLYRWGQGVPEDAVRAHMWLSLAAIHFRQRARRYTAMETRNAVAKKMTSEQITEAQRLAREWRPKGE